MFVFISFPTAAISYSDKSEIKEEGFIVALNSRYSLSWRVRQGITGLQEFVTGNPYLGETDEGKLKSAHFLHFLQHRIPNSGDGLPHN